MYQDAASHGRLLGDKGMKGSGAWFHFWDKSTGRSRGRPFCRTRGAGGRVSTWPLRKPTSSCYVSSCSSRRPTVSSTSRWVLCSSRRFPKKEKSSGTDSNRLVSDVQWKHGAAHRRRSAEPRGASGSCEAAADEGSRSQRQEPGERAAIPAAAWRSHCCKGLVTSTRRYYWKLDVNTAKNDGEYDPLDQSDSTTFTAALNGPFSVWKCCFCCW